MLLRGARGCTAASRLARGVGRTVASRPRVLKAVASFAPSVREEAQGRVGHPPDVLAGRQCFWDLRVLVCLRLLGKCAVALAFTFFAEVSLLQISCSCCRAFVKS